MPGFGIEIGFIPSLVSVSDDFDKLGLDIRSFREPLKRSVQQVIAPSIAENFAVGGRPELWDPLAPETEDNKSYYGYGGEPTLVRSGKLRKVAQQLNIWDIDQETAQLGELPASVADYGYIQNEGGTAGNGAFIPSRPFLVIQPEDEDAIVSVFDDWLGERLARVGFI